MKKFNDFINNTYINNIDQLKESLQINEDNSGHNKDIFLRTSYFLLMNVMLLRIKL